jgi:hypothetical protein
LASPIFLQQVSSTTTRMVTRLDEIAGFGQFRFSVSNDAR